jgi:hypothetical protein
MVGSSKYLNIITPFPISKRILFYYGKTGYSCYNRLQHIVTSFDTGQDKTARSTVKFISIFSESPKD